MLIISNITFENPYVNAKGDSNITFVIPMLQDKKIQTIEILFPYEIWGSILEHFQSNI